MQQYCFNAYSPPATTNCPYGCNQSTGRCNPAPTTAQNNSSTENTICTYPGQSCNLPDQIVSCSVNGVPGIKTCTLTQCSSSAPYVCSQSPTNCGPCQVVPTITPRPPSPTPAGIYCREMCLAQGNTSMECQAYPTCPTPKPGQTAPPINSCTGLREGATCLITNQSSCLGGSPLYCSAGSVVMGKCRNESCIQSSRGDSCKSSLECDSGFCHPFFGKCDFKRAEGDACNFDFECGVGSRCAEKRAGTQKVCTYSPKIQLMDEGQTCGKKIGDTEYRCRFGLQCAFNTCIKEVKECYCQNVCGSGSCSMKIPSTTSTNDVSCSPSYCNHQEDSCETASGTLKSGDMICDPSNSFALSQCKDGVMYSIPCQLGRQCVDVSSITGKPACEFTSQQEDAVQPYSSNPAFMTSGYLQSTTGQQNPFPKLNTQRYFKNTFNIDLPPDQTTGEKYGYATQTVQNLAWIYHNFGKPKEMIDKTYAYIYDSPRTYEMLTEFVNPGYFPDVNIDDLSLLSQLSTIPKAHYPYSPRFLDLWSEEDKLNNNGASAPTSSRLEELQSIEKGYYAINYGYNDPQYRTSDVFDEALNICGNYADLGVWLNAQVSNINTVSVDVANKQGGRIPTNAHKLLVTEYQGQLFAQDYTWRVLKPLSSYLHSYYPEAQVAFNLNKDPRATSEAYHGLMTIDGVNAYLYSQPSQSYPVSDEAYYSTLEDMGEYLPRYDHACGEAGWKMVDKKYGPFPIPWISACIQCDSHGRALTEDDPSMCTACSQRDQYSCHSNCKWLTCAGDLTEGACYDTGTPIAQICGEESCEGRSESSCNNQCTWYSCGVESESSCHDRGTDRFKACPTDAFCKDKPAYTYYPNSNVPTGCIICFDGWALESERENCEPCKGRSENSCNNQCAWYACGNNGQGACFDRGTETALACPSRVCTDLNKSSCMADPFCGWMGCSNGGQGECIDISDYSNISLHCPEYGNFCEDRNEGFYESDIESVECIQCFEGKPHVAHHSFCS